MTSKHNSMNLQRRASQETQRTICGVIQSLDEHCVLDPDDTVVVKLCDITLSDWTRIDTPHIPQQFIISNVKLNNCDYFPIPFTLYYKSEDIDGSLCYGIRCDILDKNHRVKYTSDKFIDVLTDQNPKTNINIIVVPYHISSTTNE